MWRIYVSYPITMSFSALTQFDIIIPTPISNTAEKHSFAFIDSERGVQNNNIVLLSRRVIYFFFPHLGRTSFRPEVTNRRTVIHITRAPHHIRLD